MNQIPQKIKRVLIEFLTVTADDFEFSELNEVIIHFLEQRFGRPFSLKDHIVNILGL